MSGYIRCTKRLLISSLLTDENVEHTSQNGGKNIFRVLYLDYIQSGGKVMNSPDCGKYQKIIDRLQKTLIL